MTLARRLAAVLSAPLMVVFSMNAVAADRIVSVGGDVTEIVYALGAGDRLVARDTTSTLPQPKNFLMWAICANSMRKVFFRLSRQWC